MNALPADMPDGEYRAYLWFSPMVAPRSLTARPVERCDLTMVQCSSFHINSYVPVYVQKGEQVQDVKFECDEPT